MVYPTDFIKGLRQCVDQALQVRDCIGAIKGEVYIVTRTWSGESVGDGRATECKIQILPTPYIVDLSHNIKLLEGGTYKQGDLLLRHISAERYAEGDLNNVTNDPLIEQFYEVDGLLYNIINIKKDYAWWDVQVRKLTDQTRYLGG